MRKLKALSFLSMAALLLLAGCATKPKPATEASPSSIQAEATGLAPAGDQRFRSINFAVLFGDSESVASWSLAIVDQKLKTAARTISGSGGELPDALSWDGETDAGALAPEGSYAAVLNVYYGNKYGPGKAVSKPFLLDIQPPSGSFSPNPAQFAYAPDGMPKPISVTIAAKPGLAKLATWRLDLFDSSGGQVKLLSGAWPANQASWDGKTDSGGYVETAKTYPAVLTLSDEYGNAGTFKGAFSVADVPGAGASAIETRRAGFSPTSTSVKNSLDLLLTVGSKGAAKAWEVQVLGVEKGSVKKIRSFTGAGPDIPEYLRWDGKDESGAVVAEGSYYATLSVDYGKAFKPASAKSRNFSVVTTPPVGSITVDPPSVGAAELGPKKPVTFTVQAKSGFARIASWVLSVSDPSGASVVVFNGAWPNNKVAWDGKTVEGGSLIPGSRYAVAAKVQDEYGNVGDLGGALAIEGLNPANEPTTIEARSPGFAPTGDGSLPTMDFALSAGDAASVKSWKVDMINESNIVEKTFSGSSKAPPATLSWDGKVDGGAFAPEGRYTAMLSLDYGLAFAPVSVESGPFVLDLSPPEGKIGLSTDLFSPDGDGTNDTVTISPSGGSKLARIVGWSLTVFDPGNSVFASWKGNWPAAAVAWDGKDPKGNLVESASDYPIELRLRDEFGNVGRARQTLATDILVIKMGDGYRIRISSIVFKPFTADYKDVPPDRAARNLKTLDLLASKLARFPDYKIRLEGHAVMINWDDKAKGEAEQAAILIPLSKDRADAIEGALVERGVAADRLVTDGVGAKDPLVPDSDYANRWRNRRVEFYILK